MKQAELSEVFKNSTNWQYSMREDKLPNIYLEYVELYALEKLCKLCKKYTYSFFIRPYVVSGQPFKILIHIFDLVER